MSEVVDAATTAVRRHRGPLVRAVAAFALGVCVVVAYSHRAQLFGAHEWVRIAAVLVLVLLGAALSQSAPQLAQPAFSKRLDPAVVGVISFLVRVAAIAVAAVVCLRVAGVNYTALAAGGAVTAVILGLAAQQTIGNMIAGAVLLTSGAFRVGARVRLRSSSFNVIEGTVESVGLLYTTIAVERPRDERILVPNSGVTQATVVSAPAPEALRLKLRLANTTQPTEIKSALERSLGDEASAVTVRLDEVDRAETLLCVEVLPRPATDPGTLTDKLAQAVREIAQNAGYHSHIYSDPY